MTIAWIFECVNVVRAMRGRKTEGVVPLSNAHLGRRKRHGDEMWCTICGPWSDLGLKITSQCQDSGESRRTSAAVSK